MKGALSNAYTQDSDEEDSTDGGKAGLKGELSACVQQTMSDLGMAYNFERFMTLLKEAGICSLEEIAKLDVNSCAQLQLPWDLVSALQQRYKVWALEMVDDAERGLEKGERHYKVSSIGKEKVVSKKSRLQSDGDNMFITPSNVVPQPVEGIAMPPTKNGASNQINMGFADLGAPNGMNQPYQNWAMSPQGNPMQQAWGDMNAQQMSASPVHSRPTSATQGGNCGAFGMQEPTLVGCDPEAIKEAVKPLEKKLEQLESKMLDKFELAMEKLGQRFERQMEKNMEQTGAGLKDMRSLVEQSQSMLGARVEAKVEFVLSSQQKENRENIEADMKKQFDLLSQKLLLQATVSQADGDNKGSAHVAQAVEQSLDIVNKKMDVFEESLKGALSRLGGSITQMMDGWAQHTIQESKAAAFTLQTKMSNLEEAQHKRGAETEQNITHKLQKLVNEGMDGVRDTVTMTTRASSDQLQTCIESAKAQNMESQREMEGKLIQFVKDLNQDFSKNVEMGMGVVGNSLRSQLEGLQASQLSHHHNTESSIATKVDSKLTNLKQEISTQSQQMAAHTQAHTQKQLDKQSDQLNSLLASTKEDMQAQRQAAEEIQSTLRDVRAGTDECSDRIAGLYDHLGVSDDARGPPQRISPQRRQSSSGLNSSSGAQPRYGR
jgi:hypothetical protein